MGTKLSKMKIPGLVFFACLFIFTAKAQQTRALGDFSGIKTGDSFTIMISQSDANTIKVEADEKAQSQIKTEVKEGILTIESEGIIKTNLPIIIRLGMKSLNSLNISGTTEVKTENRLVCDKLSIESNSAGDARLDIKATEIKIQINGAGDVTLSGTTQALDANLSGAGDLIASKMEADKAIVKTSGRGSAKINVKQNLDATISGPGDIIYLGNPAERIVNISGTGSVREGKSGTGSETDGNATKFKLGKKKYLIIDENEEMDERNKRDFLRNLNYDFKHWAGLEIGVNGMLDYNNALNAPQAASFLELNYSRSIQFGLNLFEKDFHIYKNYVNIVTGLGFDFNHYAFKNGVSLNSKTAYLSATTDSTITYKKNTFNVSYIKVPLILEFNTNKNPNNNLHFAVGGEFAFRIHAVTKQKYEANGNLNTIKNRADFNLEPFRCSAVARVGYNNITLFADYGFNRLFIKDKGPQVYPFTIGLTVSL